MDHIKAIELEMEKGIKDVLEGRESLYKHVFGCMETFICIARELGATSLEEFETNGWQADMWETLEYNGKKFHLFSEGYYGGAKITDENC